MGPGRRKVGLCLKVLFDADGFKDAGCRPLTVIAPLHLALHSNQPFKTAAQPQDEDKRAREELGCGPGTRAQRAGEDAAFRGPSVAAAARAKKRD